MTHVVTSPALLVLLLVLATARATTLVVDDMISAPFRAWVDDHVESAQVRMTDPWEWLSYLINCPWCVSIYAGGVLATITYLWHDYWPVQLVLLLLTASEVTGLLAVTRNAIEGDDS